MQSSEESSFPLKPVYNVAEVASIVGVCEEVVRRLCRKGLLKRVLGLRKIKVTRQALVDFLENRFDDGEKS